MDVASQPDRELIRGDQLKDGALYQFRDMCWIGSEETESNVRTLCERQYIVTN